MRTNSFPRSPMIVRSTRDTPRLVRARAPLRLGLAGGGSDLSPYCDTYGGYVLNATIDKYAYATVVPRTDGRVRLVAADRHQEWEGTFDELMQEQNAALDLHRSAYCRVVRELHGGQPLAITLTTTLDALPGSGLGSSSTLVVAMVTAMAAWCGVRLNGYETARMAFQIERCDAGLAGGRQDQYAAAFGGINFMEFYAGERVLVNRVDVEPAVLSELEASLMLLYSGVSRHSSAIIEEQRLRLTDDPEAVEAMHEMKAGAVRMRESLRRGDLSSIVSSMNDTWELKKRTAHAISNPFLDNLLDRVMEAGGLAGKVSGAGGGGFLIFFVDPARRMDVARALEGTGGNLSTCHFTQQGAYAWSVA
jgi:D-glycero-alpha-D-manno-heptose-7-phosphate kinase